MSAQPGIVFVHGMYMNGVSWEPWIERAKTRGVESTAPSWPFHDGTPAELRANVPAGLGMLTFGAVVDHFKGILKGLPTPPVLIGHSIGGLVVQKLINEGFGALGVAISPAPPQGIFTLDPTFFKANFPHINPFAGSRPVFMTPKRFHYAFCNTLTRRASDEAFEQFVVPESRLVPRSTLGKSAKIDFSAVRAPLFFLAGTRDHLTPVAMVRRNASKYKDDSGHVEYREFVGRSHYICGEPGWEEVAEAAIGWLWH